MSSPRQLQTLAVLLLIWAMQLSAVYAQEGTDATQISIDDVNTVARELWCPLCSGVRLDSCELQACVQMREQIAIQLAEGADTERIKAYFVEQYGPQVLGEPPREGFNWLAWILPFAVLLIGGLFLIWRGRALLPGRTPVATTEPASASSVATAEDRYTKQLEEELKAYE